MNVFIMLQALIYRLFHCKPLISQMLRCTVSLQWFPPPWKSLLIWIISCSTICQLMIWAQWFLHCQHTDSGPSNLFMAVVKGHRWCSGGTQYLIKVEMNAFKRYSTFVGAWSEISVLLMWVPCLNCPGFGSPLPNESTGKAVPWMHEIIKLLLL